MMHKRGFTLIELVVVIGIIGIIAAIVSSRVSVARQEAQTARVQSDLRQLRTAIELLIFDTASLPTVGAIKDNSNTACAVSASNNELFTGDAAAGLVSTDGNFPGWNGPYINAAITDPWGNQYVYDGDYECNDNGNAPVGCEDYGADEVVRAIHSLGPSGDDPTRQIGATFANDYDSDEIVLVLCSN